jgi:hypothetical protein
MQVVIEMNDEQYYEVCRGDSSAVLVPKDDLINVIRNGKPLPKGHGDLKDADAMINKLCTHEASELFGSITCAEIMDFISDGKTIVEADKEG